MLAEALQRPALDGAEDALLLADVFPGDPRPSLEVEAVATAPWASGWLRHAVAAAREQSPHRVARDVRCFADYMVEAVRLMQRHGHFQDRGDRQRVKALFKRAGRCGTLPARSAAAERLLSAAESPDAGRSDVLAEALGAETSGPPGGVDSATAVLLGLAALPVDKRRARLHGMGMALRASSAQGAWNG
ncbi:hypothetical protein [Azospirillum isscasi]|uniref:Uncharacterized protein n=1 Tax=Azospirillum isscasi TaxID=3053926 RepID=A0ABU0WKF2_9PROT|nr:hypothetical protein [Azospirillum isscasi]MDQ2103419.1 hypothetical protein [Azospirillum isscasi]